MELKKMYKKIELDMAQARECIESANTTPFNEQEIIEADRTLMIKEIVSCIANSKILPYSVIGMRRTGASRNNIYHTPYFHLDVASFSAHIAKSVKLPRVSKKTLNKLSKLIDALCENCGYPYVYTLGQSNAPLDTLLFFIKLVRGVVSIENMNKKDKSFIYEVFHIRPLDVRDIHLISAHAQLNLERARVTLLNHIKSFKIITDKALDDIVKFLEELEKTLKQVSYELVKAANVIKVFTRVGRGIINPEVDTMCICYSLKSAGLTPELITLD